MRISAIGENCPIPVIKARNALREMPQNAELLISVDNKIATQNLEKMCNELGYKINIQKVTDEHFDVAIIKGIADTTQTENITLASDVKEQSSDSSIVVIASEAMGEGNQDLGRALLKSFIYALTELETLPAKIIFYNGGAKLTVKNSDSLENLQKLSNNGVEIYTCGACLNFYGISEELAVGSVTNMYAIISMMQNASKVIKP